MPLWEKLFFKIYIPIVSKRTKNLVAGKCDAA
jgi:hypothetical protein